MGATRKHGRRKRAAILLVTAGVAQLLGCAPEPVPTPTPTAAFASKEEAFAAAEEVYRAYNEALNERSSGVESADPQSYLSGLALEGDIDTQNLLSSSNLHTAGAAVLEAFVGESADLDGGLATMTAIVCIDVSAVSLRDKSGVDVTPPDRGDKIVQRVYFVGTEESLRVSNELMAEDATC